MIGVSSLSFPGGKILAGWARQLAPYQPSALWVGYLFLHRVEALTCRELTSALDPLSLHVLRALVLEHKTVASPPAENGAGPDLIDRLDGRLHLGRGILVQLLHGLEKHDLLQCAQQHWCVTEQGRQGSERGELAKQSWRRECFYFVELLDAAGRRAGPPHFLPLRDVPAIPWSAGQEYPFDATLLHACLTQPPGWKQAFAFPRDVRRIESAPQAHTTEELSPPSWQKVLVDHPERWMLALILAGDQLLGFAVQPPEWALADQTPVLSLEKNARHIFPELQRDPVPELWADAWARWCEAHRVPAQQIEECALDYTDGCVHVEVPKALYRQLQASRGDVLKKDLWLLAGDGLLRPAARATVSSRH